MGAFGLAISATVHSLLAGTDNLSLLPAALWIWPLVTGVPAFVVAWGVAAVLARLPRSRTATSGR